MIVPDKIYKLAKRLAKKSNHGRYRLGCVIYKRNEVLGLGYNLLRTDPRSPDPYKFIHAEYHSTFGVEPSDLLGATAFVYMERVKSGTVGVGKPCKHCTKLLTELGLSRVYYTDNKEVKFVDL
jgi:deoxycytidylate deaminase